MAKRNILSPIQKFYQIESSSGILLLFATIMALIWANSPLAESYQSLWQYKLGFTSEGFELNKPLILWINDGLMAIFFFLIGLEIKREFLIGELNSLKKVAFPLFGALGGIILPVTLYFVLNTNPDTLKGWGVPMATDIAFSLAILNALGNRVPLSLKIFLTAFAIVDDLAAVLVIAIFYSSDIQIDMLGIALLLLGVLYLLSYKGYYTKFLMIVLGIVIWTLFLKSGIHPTLSGVLLAFSVPISQKIKTNEFVDNLVTITGNIKKAADLKEPILSKDQIREMINLQNWANKFKSPLQDLEHDLHDWVAYLIIPVFALANAGVSLHTDIGLDNNLILKIIIALVVGKSVGVTSIIFIARKLKLIEVPADISNRHIIGVSFLAGIGFTMAIFIAGLAFIDPIYVDSSKIGILIGSVVAAIIGYIILNDKKKK
ncbi:sodium:proton antiporter [Pseudalgibacter alginicilyticus]|uniref:Na(+)/H(+) antiporter NhaA n=1 Tax=Pseudalgibacter alginicilyticus TaxID=1736674 RepID=A0A0P0CM34_9FLAO|nr:Na+/H+ antiporter NhaA [Pseudalgibacter alginicilyticus]ALJ05520.1 sodium:proton antiporter [Pseudalgibacter alginicilyticus]